MLRCVISGHHRWPSRHAPPNGHAPSGGKKNTAYLWSKSVSEAKRVHTAKGPEELTVLTFYPSAGTLRAAVTQL
ncbi:hypothetical protein BC826DRAFT_1071724, partial [Russula brevipes]